MSTSPQSAVYDDDSSEMTARLPAWKQEVNDRLVAHRSRRTPNPEAQSVLPGMESAASRPAARSVAARVAERYSRVPSYREALAAEAANAARAAEAAAKAAQKAHEAAQAMNEVLWADLEEPVEEPTPEPVSGASSADPVPRRSGIAAGAAQERDTAGCRAGEPAWSGDCRSL